MITKSKSKPTCIKGTACGFTCINGKYACSSKILKRDADALLKQTGAVSKTLDYDSLPVSARLLHSHVAGDLPSWVSGTGGPGKDLLASDLLVSGASPVEAEKLATGLKSWLGSDSAYTYISPLTYKTSTQLTEDPDFDSSPRNVKELDTILSYAIQALNKLPAADYKSMEAIRSGKSKYDDLDPPTSESMLRLNRWTNVPDLSAHLSKYVKGETITEWGMFGTTHLPADQMTGFSLAANVAYEIKPKTDGTSQGKAVDKYKNYEYEGEVLFVPGTSYKVTKIEKERTAYAGEWHTSEGQLLSKETMAKHVDDISKLWKEAERWEEPSEIKSRYIAQLGAPAQAILYDSSAKTWSLDSTEMERIYGGKKIPAKIYLEEV